MGNRHPVAHPKCKSTGFDYPNKSNNEAIVVFREYSSNYYCSVWTREHDAGKFDSWQMNLEAMR
jgi:hypothetical protein